VYTTHGAKTAANLEVYFEIHKLLATFLFATLFFFVFQYLFFKGIHPFIY